MASGGIVKEELNLPDGQQKLAFVLHNVFTKQECDSLIEKTKKMGYEPALINVGFGRQERDDGVRNNDRCIWDSEEETQKMYERLKPFIPETWKGRKCLGLNERMRFLHYSKGQYFKPHYDGVYRRENGEASALTLQIYLNEGFKGGETTFLSAASVMYHIDNDDSNVPVVPKTGSVLVFQHDILHEGSELKSGEKYTMRTDVMYAAK